MLSVWTKHLKDKNEIERFQSSVLGSKAVMERLAQIMKEEVEKLDRSETDPKSYDTPGWQFKQAHKNGFRQYHQILEKLTNLDQKDKPNDLI